MAGICPVLEDNPTTKEPASVGKQWAPTCEFGVATREKHPQIFVMAGTAINNQQFFSFGIFSAWNRHQKTSPKKFPSWSSWSEGFGFFEKIGGKKSKRFEWWCRLGVQGARKKTTLHKTHHNCLFFENRKPPKKGATVVVLGFKLSLGGPFFLFKYIPGSSRHVNVLPFCICFWWKGRSFTHLEDPGIKGTHGSLLFPSISSMYPPMITFLFFPWNETGFQQMTVDLKGAATAVKHRGFRRGTKHLFEVVPVKVGAAHIQKGSGKVVNFWVALDFRLLFFREKMPFFFDAEAKLGSCIVGNKDFSFFSCWKSKVRNVGDVSKEDFGLQKCSYCFFCRIYVKGFFLGGILILGHIQVPIVRKTT